VSDLKTRRRAAGLTRERLAQLARVSVPHLQTLEGGYRPGRSEALRRVEAVLASLEVQNDSGPVAGAAVREAGYEPAVSA
jgi:transcriptional regulator with XRE-family HTH domain